MSLLPRTVAPNQPEISGQLFLAREGDQKDQLGEKVEQPDGSGSAECRLSEWMSLHSAIRPIRMDDQPESITNRSFPTFQAKHQTTTRIHLMRWMRAARAVHQETLKVVADFSTATTNQTRTLVEGTRNVTEI